MRFGFWLKDLEQTLHTYGFSPVWIRLWISNLLLLIATWEQNGQWCFNDKSWKYLLKLDDTITKKNQQKKLEQIELLQNLFTYKNEQMDINNKIPSLKILIYSLLILILIYSIKFLLNFLSFQVKDCFYCIFLSVPILFYCNSIYNCLFLINMIAQCQHISFVFQLNHSHFTIVSFQ